MMIGFYRFILLLLLLPLALLSARQAWPQRDWRYLLQRLGLTLPKMQAGGLHCHAASVGEVNAIQPLLLALRERYPQLPILLTTNTLTSAHVAARQLPDSIQHAYMPLDISWMVKAFLNRAQPCLSLVVETELWPEFYQQCHRRHIPLLIVNGRISNKTLNAPGWLKSLYRRALACSTLIMARSQTDADHFMSLGADAEKVRMTGNIKYALPLLQDVEPIELGRAYVLLASSREEEEPLVVSAWQQVRHDEQLLVIVPRHPQRKDVILQQLQPLAKHIAVRSRGDAVTDETQIYLADTIGELKGFIAGADFVVMGGSFVEKGGHNILEVAQQGKAVLFGSSMYNFADEAKLFVAKQAGQQVSIATLPAAMQALLDHPEQATEMGMNGKKLLEHGQAVLAKYIDVVSTYLDETSRSGQP